MRNKAFTLVELLAVIVILGIILAVAIPGISSIITSSTKSAFGSDAKMVLRAIDYKLMEDSNFNPSVIDETNIFSLLGLSPSNYKSIDCFLDGDKPVVMIVGQNTYKNMVACGSTHGVQVYDNLFLWYNFTNNKNDDINKNVAVDFSGNNNNGNLLNFAYDNTSGYNDGLLFDGTDDAISISWKPTDYYSISMWFYKDTFGTDAYETLIGGPSGFEIESKPGGTNLAQIWLYNWGGKLDYLFNQWNHVVFTRTPAGSKLYLNGVFQLTSSPGSLPIGQYFIGAWSVATSQNFKGKINNIMIYNRVLNDTEISNIYSIGNSKLGI